VELKDVRYTITKTGKAIPIGIIEPTLLSGSVISKATLHNFEYIRKNNFKIGSMVLLKKAGEVIPKLTCINESDLKEMKLEDLNLPMKCPCNRKLDLEIVESELYCKNDDCVPILSSKFQIFTKAINLKGISEKTIDILIENGILKSLCDIFKMKEKIELLKGIKGFGEKKIENLVEMVEQSFFHLEDVLVGLGIKSIGKESSKIIVENINISGLKSKKFTEADFTHENVSKLQTTHLFNHFNQEENRKEFLEILDYLNLKQFK
jgi:DNA ligase (NAD+)